MEALHSLTCRYEATRTPDGRLVIDHLPAVIPLLPGEVDLVAPWLMDLIDRLFEAAAMEVAA